MTRVRRPISRSRGAARGVRAGFTLVEVLATLVLIGIIIPVAMRATTLALNTASHARRQAEAAVLGDTKLVEIISQGDWQTGTSSGDFGLDWPDYTWKVQTYTTDSAANVTEVTLSVLWVERGQERTLNVSTLAYAGSTGTAGTSGTGGLP